LELFSASMKWLLGHTRYSYVLYASTKLSGLVIFLPPGVRITATMGSIAKGYFKLTKKHGTEIAKKMRHIVIIVNTLLTMYIYSLLYNKITDGKTFISFERKI
jgi:membrane-anchored glycerophosphoryl diester phosphodiesterase (GDPDase)